MLHPLALRIKQQRAQQARDAGRPLRLPRRVRNQILPDFYQQVGQAARRRMLVQRIAFQRPVIGFIVADNQARLAGQGGDEGQGQARITIPQHACMPAARMALPVWREGMQADNGRHTVGGEAHINLCPHRIPVGLPELRSARCNLSRANVCIARNNRAIGQLHHQGGIIGPAIGINQQARGACQDSGRTKQVC